MTRLVTAAGAFLEASICWVEVITNGDVGVTVTFGFGGAPSVSVIGGSVSDGRLVSTVESLQELEGWAGVVGGGAGLGPGFDVDTSISNVDGEVEITIVSGLGEGVGAHFRATPG